jgi:hypothetical protein
MVKAETGQKMREKGLHVEKECSFEQEVSVGNLDQKSRLQIKENASGLLLELRCRRPHQKEDVGVAALLKHGDIIDDSMGAFDAFDLSGESKKTLLSFGLGNYLLCVRPVHDETSFADGERPPSFEWSDDLKGVKAVRISGLFDELSHHIKKTFYGQTAESCFSMIHCGLNIMGTKIKDLYFLVRTTKRKLSVVKTRNPEPQRPQSQIVAWKEQHDILILPTISTFKIRLESYEAQTDMWMEMLRNVQICIVYRARLVSFEQKDVVYGKTLTSFYTLLKQVLNNTGLDLLCCFDDNIEAKISSWHSDSFLIRHMVSRKDLRPKCSLHMSLQLDKSGVVSSITVHISLEELGVTTLRTRLVSGQPERKAPGPLVVVDVSKQNEDGLSVTFSPMVRIHISKPKNNNPAVKNNCTH